MVEIEKEIKLSWLNCQNFSIKLGSSLQNLKENIENVTGIPQSLQKFQLDKAMIEEEEKLYESILQKADSTLRILSKEPDFIEYNNKIEGGEYDKEIEEHKDALIEDDSIEDNKSIENSPQEEAKDVEAIIIVKKEKQTITIKDSCTILELKYKIEEEMKIAFDCQILFYKGVLLRNNEKISSLKSSAIVIKLMKRATGQKFDINKIINLKISGKSSFALVVSPKTTIEGIKNFIFNQHGYDQNSQSLYLNEKLLEDSETLNVIFKNHEPELSLFLRSIGCGVKKKKVLAVDLKTKQKSSDKPNKHIKPITRHFNIYIECKNKCEELKDILFDEGLIIGHEDFQTHCKCGESNNIDIIVHDASWKFFGVKNGNRVILNNRKVIGDDLAFILQENKQISDLSKFSEFRFEVQKIKASK